jgi:2-amino-4-hydroxy-6-hydroxymethyldihydropteridine diphosphokinase
VSWVTAAVGLGSNVGDRLQHLERAVREIAAVAGVRVVAVSRWIETEAQEGAAGQSHFLNGALVIETRLSARELLEELRSIERAHGRERDQRPEGVRHAPRTLDLDLLVHGSTVVDEPGLTVPHPRMRERAFVLAPLAEIAPDLVVPDPAARMGADRTGSESTVRALLAALRGQSARSAGG